MYIKFYGLHNRTVADVHRNICIVLIELKLYDTALEYYHRSIHILQSFQSPSYFSIINL